MYSSFSSRGRWSQIPFSRPWAVLLLLSAWPMHSAAPVSAIETPEITLEDAVDTALGQSPELAALRARTRALATLPAQVGSLPDPVLSLNAMNLPTDTFDFDQEPMTQTQIAVSQMIPFPGKRQLRRSAATFEAHAADAQVAELRDALIGNVRGAWWRLFAIDRALEIVTQNKALMRDFVNIAQTKYAVGRGLQQDVLLAQLELSRLLDREMRLTGRRRSLQAALNGLLDRSPDRIIVLARTPPSTRLPELPDEKDLLQRAVEYRDELASHRDRIRAADERVALARRDRYPDFRLGAGYGFRQSEDAAGRDRPDFFTVMFSVSVPLYAGNKQNQAITQRRLEREQRAYALSMATRSIETAIGRNLADYEAARDQVSLLETAIIPQAQQTVASMLAGYQVNEVDFLNVVNGQITLYNAQINYWTSLSDAKRMLAAVAAAVGTEALYE